MSAAASPHACTLLPDGTERCLGCGRPWPCEAAPRPGVEAVVVTPESGPRHALDAPPGPDDVIAAAAQARLPWHLVADQLGVDRQRVRDILDLDGAH